ncbi:hypothetical protein GCM10010313_50990 [Streptomyces violarus]|uniref:Uncharacterized protein n=1 Tax=Streptomyces violarus TaxID=67380 RepID=A0A7W4ZSV4_9ACTN|nr:hypothetical protein [Streptomyces violarus]GHD19607.1 hypothetical protein GCM10010313_50990 [Streptomyces violarus]
MTEPSAQYKKPFLYVVVCATGVADGVGNLINAAQERHRDIGVIAAPQGLGFLDAEAIPSQTGYPIRSAMVFKLVESAQQRWPAVNAPHLVTLVRAGARFERGQLVERPGAIAA